MDCGVFAAAACYWCCYCNRFSTSTGCDCALLKCWSGRKDRLFIKGFSQWWTVTMKHLVCLVHRPSLFFFAHYCCYCPSGLQSVSLQSKSTCASLAVLPILVMHRVFNDDEGSLPSFDKAKMTACRRQFTQSRKRRRTINKRSKTEDHWPARWHLPGSVVEKLGDSQIHLQDGCYRWYRCHLTDLRAALVTLHLIFIESITIWMQKPKDGAHGKHNKPVIIKAGICFAQ